MTIIYSTEGHFCEGNPPIKWQMSLYLGRIILTEELLSLIKQSNISLTGKLTEIDDFNEGFKIPLSNIKKANLEKLKKDFFINIETRDGFYFSITMAEHKKHGERKGRELCDLINGVILGSMKEIEKEKKCPTCGDTLGKDEKSCDICGNDHKSNKEFCEECGSKVQVNSKFCEKCGKKL